MAGRVIEVSPSVARRGFAERIPRFHDRGHTACVRVIVLGAGGEMGSRVCALLEARGHSVGRASRRTGVDAYSGAGLVDAFRGADAVLDCLNVQTLSRRRAVRFFSTTARNVATAARQAQVEHVVCVSIANVDDPAVSRRMGYYAGKAVQASVYREAGIPVSIVSSTQWFELARTLLHQIRLGALAFVPHLLSRPVAADSVAAILADVVAGRVVRGSLVVAGPERLDMVDLARRVAAVEEPSTRVIGIPGLGRAVRSGALIPRGDALIDSVRCDDWLLRRSR